MRGEKTHVKETRGVSTFQVAATYIGTVVGAGFASGQEILQFFGFFGLYGFLALVVATALFIFFGLAILELGRKLEADSHLPVIRAAGGKWVGTLVDWVITFFLFGAFTAMAAGAGALFKEQFGLSPLLGNGLLIAGTLITVMIGLSGVINAISFVVPVLLASVLAISLATFASAGFALPGADQLHEAAAAAGRPPVPFWPLSAVVYVSYNLVVAVAVLAPLGKEAKSARVLTRGALWGGLGLGLGAASIFLALLINMPAAARFDIPMLHIGGRILPWVPAAYSIVLLAEIYTTAVGSLYGFVARLAQPGSATIRWITLGSGVAAFVASQFGFTTLVRVLYPAVGVAGLTMLAGLTWYFWRKRFVPAPAYIKTLEPKESSGDSEEESGRHKLS